MSEDQGVWATGPHLSAPEITPVRDLPRPQKTKAKVPQPALPLFAKHEVKSLRIEFEEHEGAVLINIDSEGMEQDPNQIALFLHFALEKLLDAEV